MFQKLMMTLGGLALSWSVSAADVTNAHDFTLTSIDYTEMPMKQFAGKAVLLVNTASFCGFTPQYEGLQKLWTDYKEKGLVIIGVPANDFGEQEPDDEGKIKEFCEVNFQVDFPMTKKMIVDGKAGTAAIYDWLAVELGDASRPKWNFHKYLISPEGEAVAFFPSKVTPNSDELLTAVNETLHR